MADEQDDVLKTLFGMHGKTVIVTGAAMGIGRGVAALFAKAGARVILGDLDGDKARQSAEAIDRNAIGLALDVADEASVERFYKQVDQHAGSIDALINNAGIYFTRPFGEVTTSEWNRVHAVNTLGTFLCLRGAVQRMKSSGKGGAIVNISSVAALGACIFDNVHYGSSKGAVNAITAGMALELAGDGIRVNAIMPGSVATEGAAALHGQTERKTQGPFTQPGRIPLARRGGPIDIAAMALFLCSEASSYVTGEIIAVDGGFHIS